VRLSKTLEEIIRKILLDNIYEKEHEYIKSKITNSWFDDENYVIVFEEMSPNCISYYIDKDEVENAIRKNKIKKLIDEC